MMDRFRLILMGVRGEVGHIAIERYDASEGEWFRKGGISLRVESMYAYVAATGLPLLDRHGEFEVDLTTSMKRSA